MKADKIIAAYHRLHRQPVWRLLAAGHAPIIIGLLQTHLGGTERSLPASVFHDRVERDLEDLRAAGIALPQTTQAYVAHWLADGYLERRFPPGAAEEEYELSVAAVTAIRFVAELIEPRSIATESRLAVVIHQLVRLAQQTDSDPHSRTAALLAERDRLDKQIAAARQGRLTPLSDTQALEGIREIISLADELNGDFRRVRDRFESLNRDLRERLVNDEAGNRGEALQALFEGVDLIADSDAGRTFSAFWKLLTDPEQSAALEDSLEQVLARAFANRLEPRERRFLRQLTRALLDQGGAVHEVLQNFARSLKHFVQSREYLEQRRLSQLLREAQRAALEVKEHTSAAAPVGYTLQLTSSRVRSTTQWVLFDPSLHAPGEAMKDAQAPPIGLEAVGELIAQSEIDFRGLKANLRRMLEEHSQACISQVLEHFPATQGLGSVLGYIALGSRHGVLAGRDEQVTWKSHGAQRSARIPLIYFLKERKHELA